MRRQGKAGGTHHFTVARIQAMKASNRIGHQDEASARPRQCTVVLAVSRELHIGWTGKFWPVRGVPSKTCTSEPGPSSQIPPPLKSLIGIKRLSTAAFLESLWSPVRRS